MKSTTPVSLSVTVTFCAVVVPSATPAEGLEIVSVAVSSPSRRWSLTTVNVTEPVVIVSRMVIVALERVKSPAVMPVPVTPRSTVWFPETALAAVAVTVTTVVPASVPVVTSTDNSTVGAVGSVASISKAPISTAIPSWRSVKPRWSAVKAAAAGLLPAFCAALPVVMA